MVSWGGQHLLWCWAAQMRQRQGNGKGFSDNHGQSAIAARDYLVSSLKRRDLSSVPCRLNPATLIEHQDPGWQSQQGGHELKALLLPLILLNEDLTHWEGWQTGGGGGERCHWKQSSFVLPAPGYSGNLFFHPLAPTQESLLHGAHASPLPNSRLKKLALPTRSALKGGRF